MRAHFFSHRGRVFILLSLVLVPLCLNLLSRGSFAANGINKTINFQGKVVNSDGTNVTDGSYTFVFKLYTVSSNGTAIWTESKSVSVSNGIFRTALGDTTPFPVGVDFNTDSLYLGINFNSDGEMTPRVQFTATPYAFNADQVNGVTAASVSGQLTLKPFLQGGLTVTTFGNGNALNLSTSLGTAGNSGDITIKSGGTVTSGNSGNITIDTGAAAGTAGTITIAGTNATGLTLGRSGQNITLPAFTANNNSVLYAGGSGIIAAASTTSTGLCLTSNGASAAPTWGSCGSGTNLWQINSGVLSPGNQTLDLTFGGTATSGAKFALSLLGTNSTATINGTTSKAALTVTNTGTGDLFTASSGASTKFVIDANGNLGIGTSIPSYPLYVKSSGSTNNLHNAYSEVTHTTTATSVYNSEFVTYLNNSSGTINGAYTFFGQSFYQGTSNASPAVGTMYSALFRNGIVGTSPTGTISNSYGFYADAFQNFSGGSPNVTLSNNFGVGIGNMGSGNGAGGLTITRAYGIDVTAQTGASTDNISLRLNGANGGSGSNINIYDVQQGTGLTVPGYNALVYNLQTINTTGGVKTNYAYYISNTGSRSAGSNALTNVGLYVTASGAQANYAAIFDQGSVGIGSTAPTTALDVVGTGSFSNGITLGGGAITLGGVTGSGQCITGGATASWGSCGSGGGANFWQVNSGVLSPGNQTLDLTFGGISTAAAKVAFSLSGTKPVATIAANTSAAAVVVDQTGAGDIFTASRSGETKFIIDKDGRLIVGAQANTSALLPGTVAHFQSNVNSYSQINHKNISSGGSASTDFVATADNGNDTSNYIDFGINSSNYSDSLYSIGGANDGYLYNNGGNLSIGTQTLSKIIKFHTGGTLSGNERMRIDGQGNVGIGTTSPTALLTVAGTAPAGNAALIVSQANGNDIFTASAGATTRFTITNGGNIKLISNNTSGTDVNASMYINASSVTTGHGLYVNATSLLANGIGSQINGQSAITSGTVISDYGLMIAANGSSANASFIGTRGTSYGTGGFDITGTLNGVEGLAQNANSSGVTVSSARGVFGYAQQSGTGTITNASGVYGQIYNTAGTITNGYALYAANPNSSGTLTTAYGLYVEPQTKGNTNYGIYVGGFQNYISGNVGIGTVTSPASLLDVRGASGDNAVARFVSSNSTSDLFTASSGATTRFTIANNGTIKNLNTSVYNCSGLGNSGKLTVDSSGTITCAADQGGAGGSGNNWWQINNGVLSPGNQTLDVTFGGIATSGAKFALSLSGTNATQTINGSTSYAADTIIQNGVGDIFTASSGANTRFVIQNAGNVGIGTSLPTAGFMLDVVGAGRFNNGVTLGSAQSYTGAGAVTLSSGGSGNLTLDASSRIVTINTGNQLGIGTTNPLGTIDVRSQNGTEPTASVSGATSFAGLVVDNSGVGDLLTASSSGLNRFVIRQNGSVGIGTTLPTEKLQVSGGNIRIDAQTNAITPLAKISQAQPGKIAAGGSSTELIASVSASVVYNGSLYVGTGRGGAAPSGGAEIYRYNPTSGGWTVLNSTAGTLNSTANIASISAMTVFNGQLYVGTYKTGGAEVYRYDGGAPGTWTRVSNPTPGTINNGGTSAIDGVTAMAVYNGKLFIGTTKGDATGVGAAEVYRYEGNATWTKVTSTTGTIGAAATAGTVGVVSMSVYNGTLVIGTKRAASAAVFAYNGIPAAAAFTVISPTTGTFCASGATLVSSIPSLTVYNGSLYAGTQTTNGAQVCRYNGRGSLDTNVATIATWTSVVSGNGTIRSGGTGSILAIRSMTVYNGRLYIGTEKAGAGEIYQYIDGVDWIVLNATPGTFVSGGTSTIDTVTTMIQYNSTLYVGTSVISSQPAANKAAEIYSYSNITDQSYALKFHASSLWNNTEVSGVTNDAAIWFMASPSAQLTTGNSVNTGSFMFSHGLITGAGAYDVAEDYGIRDASATPGDLISIDENETGFVRKASGPYDTHIVGVYSENPGFRLSQQDATINGAPTIPVALVGRVMVKVSTENGAIHSGDYLTSSSVAGVAMKATKAGAVVGKAMGDYTDQGVGKVLVYVTASTTNGQSLDSLLPEGLSTGRNLFGAQLLAELQSHISTTEGALSDIYADRIAEGLEIVTPKLTAGEVDASTLTVSGDATISGTLTVDRLHVNNLDGLDILLSQTPLSSSESALLTNLNTRVEDISKALNKLKNVDLLSTVSLDATGSAITTVRDGFMVFGSTTLAEASVLNTLTIGTTLHISDNSINTLGVPFEIQPMRQADISFMGGSIVISTDGTLHVNENAEFAKDVSVAGVLSATAIRGINDNLSVSGSATFDKIQFTHPDITVISNTEVAASASAGIVTLKANQNHVKINNGKVGANSLLFITPKTNTRGKQLFIKEQRNGEYFTVGIDETASFDIDFNFLIVN